MDHLSRFPCHNCNSLISKNERTCQSCGHVIRSLNKIEDKIIHILIDSEKEAKKSLKKKTFIPFGIIILFLISLSIFLTDSKSGFIVEAILGSIIILFFYMGLCEKIDESSGFEALNRYFTVKIALIKFNIEFPENTPKREEAIKIMRNIIDTFVDGLKIDIKILF